jgi:hypothetical protein
MYNLMALFKFNTGVIDRNSETNAQQQLYTVRSGARDGQDDDADVFGLDD